MHNLSRLQHCWPGVPVREMEATHEAASLCSLWGFPAASTVSSCVLSE